MIHRGAGVLAAALLLAAPLAARADVRVPQLGQQEAACLEDGWQKTTLTVAGHERELLWRGPATWSGGAILAMHGGSGAAFNFCYESPLADTSGTVGFAADAIAAGFAVFALESTSNTVTDDFGFICGKVWDDERRDRPNVDLPFLDAVMDDIVPSVRPAGSSPSLFLTGLSSGGFMSVRAASHFGDRIRATAPVSAGDPYGWLRRCSPARGMHGYPPWFTVWGKGYDRDTDLEITTVGACEDDAPANETLWDTPPTGPPPVLVSHNEDDGIVDTSCHRRLVNQLGAHGYDTTVQLLPSAGLRSQDGHLWQLAYNKQILEFFAEHSEPARPTNEGSYP